MEEGIVNRTLFVATLVASLGISLPTTAESNGVEE